LNIIEYLFCERLFGQVLLIEKKCGRKSAAGGRKMWQKKWQEKCGRKSAAEKCGRKKKRVAKVRQKSVVEKCGRKRQKKWQEKCGRKSVAEKRKSVAEKSAAEKCGRKMWQKNRGNSRIVTTKPWTTECYKKKNVWFSYV
jgi:hypothetical protein